MQRKTLFPAVLFPVINPSPKQFAVPWPQEAGLRGKIIGHDPFEDEESVIPHKRCQKKQININEIPDTPDEKFVDDDEPHQPEEYGQIPEPPAHVRPVEIYLYSHGGAMTVSTTAYPQFAGISVDQTQEPTYRINGRNSKRRIPCCRPAQKS